MVADRHRVPGTNVLVDCFRPPRPKWASAFFLTHYHSDHYGGLTFKWRGPVIYASSLTARLVVHHLGVSPCHVKGLELNERCAVLEEAGEGLTVTLLDANHCPGSVLMLFETSAGQRYLHTGDMRYHPRMKLYRELREGQQIDILYQDTTYCNKKYKFPVQEEAISMVVETAVKELSMEPRTLILVATYLIGKERVLEALSSRLARKIYVTEPKERILRLLELPYYEDVFTTSPVDSNIHVTQWEGFTDSVPWGFKPHYEKMLEILKTENIRKQGAGGEENFYRRIVGFVPTGWTYDVKDSMSKHEKGTCGLYGVPYSEHSSFVELLEWVGFLRPKKVVPTVGGGTLSKEASMLSNFRGLIDDTAAKSQFLGLLGTKRKSPDDSTGLVQPSTEVPATESETTATDHTEDHAAECVDREPPTTVAGKPRAGLPESREEGKAATTETPSRTDEKKPIHAFFGAQAKKSEKSGGGEALDGGKLTEENVLLQRKPNPRAEGVSQLSVKKSPLPATARGAVKKLCNGRTAKSNLQQSTLSAFFQSGQH
mmetsp:Transcript_4466/g.13544  ORF Transcript_4466/g.13544 Transcript_4466/m.13544 type:complete len:543 (-) Transcript_4466:862-2490(-)